MLKIKNVSKKYSNKTVLDNLSLEVNKGEIVALMGPSGVGKSTILRILNNLEAADSGSISLNDKELNLTQVNKTHTVGMVFQGFNLFVNMRVEQNITFVLEKSLNLNPQEAKTQAHLLLDKFGLLDKKNEITANLSGGQKQRLAIARAVSLKPQIICLDEPTSALDPLLTTHVAQTITKLAQDGYHILIATHDTQFVEKLNCTIYLMENGSIIETASSQELAQDKEKENRINKFLTGNIE